MTFLLHSPSVCDSFAPFLCPNTHRSIPPLYSLLQSSVSEKAEVCRNAFFNVAKIRNLKIIKKFVEIVQHKNVEF